MPDQSRRVLLYGDVNLNILDGSAVWLTSMAEVWTLAGARVDVQLKAREQRDLLSGVLHQLPGVTVLPAEPVGQHDEMSPDRAAEVLIAHDQTEHYDVVMARGIRICTELAKRSAFPGRFWSYVTEYTYPAEPMAEDALAALGQVASASRLVLAQTEQARAVLEALVPEAAGRTAVLAPMVPDQLRPSTQGSEPAADRPLQLVYTGKFARHWRTDLMPLLVHALAELGVPATLTMVGDKVHHDPVVKDWADGMRAVMAAGDERVVWAGGTDRAGAIEAAARADMTLGWRSTELDLSLEISTKVLESCALGVPPLVNRTTAHEDLLGADYPLFVDAVVDGPAEIAATVAAAAKRLPEVSERVLAAAEPYRMSARAEVLKSYLHRVLGPERPGRVDVAEGSRPLRVVLASHDLKFAGELIDLLKGRDDVELRTDRWESLHRHDEAASEKALAWADVVICEWAGPNAVWYSQHKREGQRLIVRLHMFELRGAWLKDLDCSAVDQLITVSGLYRDLALENLPIAPDKVTVVPNTISMADLEREGRPGREFRLGIVGIVPLRKRLDRAVDLLRALHREDDRYTLHVRGRMPWEYAHEWRKPGQRESYMDLFARLGHDPIRTKVAFEPFAADMANWLGKIGWVLSPSTVESFHLAPMEGMAAGALPVFWDRPGVRGIYGDDFVVPDTEAAADLILDFNADGQKRAEAEDRTRELARSFDERAVAEQWERLLFAQI